MIVTPLITSIKFRSNMKTVKIVLFLLILTLKFPIYSQDNTVVPLRTPEQEAVRQTEKLQQELNLNSNQARQIYEINLRYARERLISNKRSAGLERAKNKNTEIQHVLSPEQNDRLQTKRYERTSIENQTINRNQPTNSTGFRSSSDFRTNQSDLNFRNNNRQVNPNFQNRNQNDQSIRRSTAPTYRTTQNQSNPYSNRTSSGSSTSTPRRYESSTPTNNPPSRSQGAPANTQRRSEPTYAPNTPSRQQAPTSAPAPTRRSNTPVNTNRN
jgi:uncharacterized protein YifN (PemK superfamily)